MEKIFNLNFFFVLTIMFEIPVIVIVHVCMVTFFGPKLNISLFIALLIYRCMRSMEK